MVSQVYTHVETNRILHIGCVQCGTRQRNSVKLEEKEGIEKPINPIECGVSSRSSCEPTNCKQTNNCEAIWEI